MNRKREGRKRREQAKMMKLPYIMSALLAVLLVALRERAVDEARTVLGETAFEEARERGRKMTFEQAVEYALRDGEPSPT